MKKKTAKKAKRKVAPRHAKTLGYVETVGMMIRALFAALNETTVTLHDMNGKSVLVLDHPERGGAEGIALLIKVILAANKEAK